MRPFFPSILPPEPIQKAPTVREVGRASHMLIAEYGMAAHTLIYSAMLEEGETLTHRRCEEKAVVIFEARKETPRRNPNGGKS